MTRRSDATAVVGRRVTVPLFELASNPTVELSKLKTRRFRDSFCPLCLTRHTDLQVHIESMGDDLHAVLDVQES